MLHLVIYLLTSVLYVCTVQQKSISFKYNSYLNQVYFFFSTLRFPSFDIHDHACLFQPAKVTLNHSQLLNRLKWDVLRVMRQKQTSFWQKQRHYFKFKWDDIYSNTHTNCSRLLVKAVSASNTWVVALNEKGTLPCFVQFLLILLKTPGLMIHR